MSGLFGSVSVVGKALDYHLERHNVLSSNIANTDTPGFRPQELVRTDVFDPEHTLPLAITRQSHLPSAQAADPGKRYERKEDRTVNPGGDGNSVSLERESAKLAANDLRYEGSVKLVNQHLAMLRYAANDGR